MKTNYLLLSCLSDFMTCSARFNIESEGSIYQIWNTVEKLNLVGIYMFIRHS